MKNIRKLLGIILTLSSLLFIHAHATTQHLSHSEFYQIIICTYEYLKTLKTPVFEINESGFVRIHVPLDNLPRLKKNNIEKVRLNFWIPGQVIDLSPHTHPAPFDSIIIKGGYQHDLFSNPTDNNKKVMQYNRYKKKRDRSMSLQGESFLQLNQSQVTHTNMIIHFDKQLIHRIVDSDPETLSLNVVFKTQKNESYYVYIDPKENLTPVDIRTPRNRIEHSKAIELKNRILGILENYINKHCDLNTTCDDTLN